MEDREDHFFAEISRIRVLVPPPAIPSSYALGVPIHDTSLLPMLISPSDIED